MSLTELATLLQNIPGFVGRVAYESFPEGEYPGLPVIRFKQTGSNTFAADNRVYYSNLIVSVELFTQVKSPETEAALESALACAELIWTKDEDYLDSERCYMITYTVTF